MATNQVYDEGDSLSVVCTDPATPSSGDPVLFGELAGVALTDERSDGTTTVAFEGVFRLSVKGYNGSANAALAAGASVYYKSGSTPALNGDTSGVKYGVLLEAVASGATSTVMVRLNGAAV